MIKEKKEIFLSPSIFQLVCKHLASYSVIHDARGEVHLFRIIQLLQNIIPEEMVLKTYNLEEYNKIKKTLIDFGKIVFHINQHFDLLKDADYKNSSVWKESYRDYLFSLSNLPIIYPNIIKYFYFLINCTTLKNSSIPSEYINTASKDLIDFTTEIDMDKRIHDFKKKKIEDKKIMEDVLKDVD